LSQDRSLARNIDSKNSVPGFDYCPRAARRRLYRQHRSLCDICWSSADVRKGLGTRHWSAPVECRWRAM